MYFYFFMYKKHIQKYKKKHLTFFFTHYSEGCDNINKITLFTIEGNERMRKIKPNDEKPA